VLSGISTVERHGLSDQIDGGVAVADLERDPAEKMPTARMTRIGRQDLAVEPLSLGELPGLMMLLRNGEQRGDAARRAAALGAGAVGMLPAGPPPLAAARRSFRLTEQLAGMASFASRFFRPNRADVITIWQDMRGPSNAQSRIGPRETRTDRRWCGRQWHSVWQAEPSIRGGVVLATCHIAGPA